MTVIVINAPIIPPSKVYLFSTCHNAPTLSLPVKIHANTQTRNAENCIVYDYENRVENKIYDMEKTTGNDMYEIFLGGSKSLISIENPDAKTDRELVMFRDSFGSSIAPLLAEDYAKITLVDIRYLPVERIGNYIDFKDQDVLFLYSTSVLNHSETLK